MTNRLELTATNFAFAYAIDALAHATDHDEFDLAATDRDELAQNIADDLDDLYHNNNFDPYTEFFFDLPTDETEMTAQYDALYALCDDASDIAADILLIHANRTDPFAAFRPAK